MLTKLLKVHAWKEVNETVTWEQQSYEASEDAELPETKPMTAYERVQASRASGRPTGADYIRTIFHDFIELHGDRRFADDSAIVAGVAWLRDMPVTVIAIEKGKDLTERFKRNFGSPMPEGYRKALRLMKQAEKFHRPVVCFVDTAGAGCDMGAEARGQGQAIAENLMEMMWLKTPIVSVMVGQGGSGGALALSVANEVWMEENAWYSVISPEGCASILWKDSNKVHEACRLPASDRSRPAGAGCDRHGAARGGSQGLLPHLPVSRGPSGAQTAPADGALRRGCGSAALCKVPQVRHAERRNLSFLFR